MTSNINWIAPYISKNMRRNLNIAYRNIRYHATSKYMTKKELVNMLKNSGFSERTSYRYLKDLENNNKLKTINLYKIK